MWHKLEQVELRFEELSKLLSSPEVVSDMQLLKQYSKEHKDISEVVATYRSYRKLKRELEEAKEMQASATDADMAAMAKEEIDLLHRRLPEIEEKMKILLLPKDPNDEKNVIFEIRAGAGGNEAGLFAAELFRMFTRYAEQRRWKVDLLSASEAQAGGFKEVIAMISGQGAFSRFRYERGVHRVQRVPVTEASGRIHTSTVTVAVLPEAEEVDVEILDKDIKVDVYRSSGPGGQSVNTTDSAVRVTHLPTGMVVCMQDEKSQLKNKDKALKVLRARLLEQKQAEADAERRDDRRRQVGSGDRSEKIRTYNFPQCRITDHRIGLTLHNLPEVMEGDLDTLIDPLVAYYQAEALKGGDKE
ncbi:MAG: peptide chain release factor 1 [Deltaproteobacteria bacterium]|nr:peptide chain release factor 1 [Deltaproteobacteria bacterium]